MKIRRLMKLSLTDELLLHNKSKGTRRRRCTTELDYQKTHPQQAKIEGATLTPQIPSQEVMKSQLYVGLKQPDARPYTIRKFIWSRQSWKTNQPRFRLYEIKRYDEKAVRRREDGETRIPQEKEQRCC